MTQTTGFDLPRVRRPGLRAWGQFVIAEARSVIRDTAGLIIPIGLPLLLLISQGLSATEEEVSGAGGRSALEVYLLPMAFVMIMALVGVVNMPSFLATYRKMGLLKRFAATPAHPLMVLVAQVITSIIQTAIGLGLALAVTAVAFGVEGPENVAAAAGVLVLLAAAMYAIGMFVGAISPTTNASIALGLLLFFLMGATGGMFGPADNLPEPMARFGEWLPFGAGLQALQAAWTGSSIEAGHVVALGVAVVVGTVSSVRFFRWSR